ncbi:MAG: GerMN domain-containing protein [Pseudomonadota bacterium]
MKRNIIAAVIIIVVVAAAYGFLRLMTSPDRALSPPGEVDLGQTAASMPESREMDLFFADTTGRRLSIERREVAGENREETVKHIIEELIKGPSDDTRLRTLPDSILVRAVFSEGGTVWVDFGGSIQDEHPGGAWTEVLAVYSIVNSVTENFTDVNEVQILINGRESETFAGHVDISEPLQNRIQLLSGEWE